jgi:hypothetical protein
MARGQIKSLDQRDELLHAHNLVNDIRDVEVAIGPCLAFGAGHENNGQPQAEHQAQSLPDLRNFAMADMAGFAAALPNPWSGGFGAVTSIGAAGAGMNYFWHTGTGVGVCVGRSALHM